MASGLAKLFVQIVGDSSDFEKKLKGVAGTIDGVGGKLQKAGAGISSAGAKLTAGVTAPILAGAALATKAAIDYESAFAGVRKTVTATDAELATLSDGLRGLAKVKPISIIDLAGIAEAAGQLGIKKGNIIPFTGVIADLSVTTNLGDDAASTLAQFANITGMSQKDFDRLGSTVVALGNNLATTEADIVSMAQRIAGAGSVVGLTEAQILGLAGGLSSVGINAEAGGSAISKVLIDMANAAATGGDDLQNFADVAGVSATDFAKQFKSDPAAAFLSFVGGLQRIQDEGGNVFATLDKLGLSEIRVRDALLRAAGAGTLFNDAMAIGTAAWAENSALANEAAQRYGTTASKLQLLKNRATDVLISVGGPLIDALTAALVAAEPFFKMIENGANAFAAMDPGTQQTILGIVGVVAAAGPALVILGNLITVIGGAVSLFSGLAGVAGTVAGAFAAGGPLMTALGAVAAFLTGPIGLAIAGVVLAVGGLYLAWKNNWFGMRDATRIAIDAMRSWIDGLRTWLYSLKWPAWLGGGAMVTPPSVPQVNSPGFSSGGSIGGASGSSFPSSAPTARSGATVQNNTINAPLIGSVTVRSEEDMNRIQRFISAELEAALNVSIDSGTRGFAGAR